MEATAEKELKPQGDLVFALDIGTRTVVGIVGEYIDDKFYLQDYVSVPHTKRAMVDGQVEDIKQVAKIVAQAKSILEERNGVELAKVSIAAAGRALKTVQVQLEFDVSDRDVLTEDIVKSMEVETIQKAQAQLDASNTGRTLFYCVGHSIISYRLDDYKIISLEGHKGDKVTIDLVAAFLPSIVVEGLYSVMDINGLEVTSLTLEPIAAMNVIVPPEIRLINIALIDIGAGTSDIAIAKNGSVVAYAMATTAGDEITEEIIRTYLVDFNTAEMIKQACSNGEETIEYRDILGNPHKAKGTDVAEMLTPAVETLADTICNSIKEANGSSPAAVFLVGGGSLIEGLTPLVAEKLGLDETRVAIGGGDFLKNVDECGAKLGAEYVTPLGIAVTSMLDQGYDFSVITVNDSKVRVFDTKQLSVYEALTIAGYKSHEIMGRSGRNLTYTLNGVRRTIKGGAMTPAEVFVNERPASIMTKVTQGDRIRITPAMSGYNASAALSDVVGYDRFNSGVVEFGGDKYAIGLKAVVNGEKKDPDYQIQPLDSIETSGIVTFGDLLRIVEGGTEGVEYRVGEDPITEDYVLENGDVIRMYDSYGNIIGEDIDIPEKPAPVQEPVNNGPVVAIRVADLEAAEKAEEAASDPNADAEEKADDAEKTDEAQSGAADEINAADEQEEVRPVKSANAIPFNGGGIHVEINGDEVILPPRNGDYILLDLLNSINIDPAVPNSEIILEINGAPANFSSYISNGDKAVIKVQERQERKIAK
ncbi:MAG: pilus assembly protein PilM [Ruminiclostridium sp.]|nr:pilus assembly protein PilM [Ruminiclostridium sp.]